MPVTVAVNNPALFYSPYNWIPSGAAYTVPMLSGNYVRFKFSGSSLALKLTVGPYDPLTCNPASSCD